MSIGLRTNTQEDSWGVWGLLDSVVNTGSRYLGRAFEMAGDGFLRRIDDAPEMTADETPAPPVNKLPIASEMGSGLNPVLIFSGVAVVATLIFLVSKK